MATWVMATNSAESVTLRHEGRVQAEGYGCAGLTKR
jgi:hypothetical protein